MAWCVLSGHGALYLRWKTQGEVQRRSTRAAWLLWGLAVVLGLAATVATARVQPELLSRMLSRPWLWSMPVWIVASLVLLFVSLRKGAELAPFLGSSSFIAAMLVATAAGLFPVFLRSTVAPQFTLHAFNASSGPRALTTGLAWWLPALVLAVLYFVYLFRSMRGKATSEEHGY
jgi:cytochrome d ubiquinol oxidase subunit II